MNANAKSSNLMSKANGLARTAVLALGLCGAVVAGSAGLTGHAEARVADQRLSQHEASCGLIQDSYDYWYGQFLSAKTPAAKAKARDAMNSYAALWDRDCGDFGSVAFLQAGTNVLSSHVAVTLSPAQPTTGHSSTSQLSTTQSR